ncbi:MAG: family transcriptional regulator, regulator of embCAB operon [Actinomycetota bacterium]|jgi:PAS domain S-box-containing protein|nr:family transcriptional regulator, regulator of embCAB operon [Actinomycetota bacterium]
MEASNRQPPPFSAADGTGVPARAETEGARQSLIDLRQADLEVVAESIPHIVWMAGADGSTDYFNRRGTAYTGLPQQANYDWAWVELVHPDDAERARRAWEHATRTATDYELTYRIRRHDGHYRWHMFRALPIRGPDGAIVRWIGTAEELGDLCLLGEEVSRFEGRTQALRPLLEALDPGPGPRRRLDLVPPPSDGNDAASSPAHEGGPAGIGPAPDPVDVEVSVLGTFSVRVGGTTLRSLAAGSQRLLAFLALQDRVVSRVAAAGRMWPDATDRRAGVSLRSALSRLEDSTRRAIRATSTGLSLAETIRVDLRDARALAHRLLGAGTVPAADLSPAATAALSVELLPDWYDEWVVSEAEDWRQLRSHALEQQARLLAIDGNLAAAVEAAHAALRVDPLRESAHATLIRVHLAEGNQSEALRVFTRYQTLLRRELDLEPTRLLCDLVAGIRKV